MLHQEAAASFTTVMWGSWFTVNTSAVHLPSDLELHTHTTCKAPNPIPCGKGCTPFQNLILRYMYETHYLIVDSAGRYF
jgi:hypothetical protein